MRLTRTITMEGRDRVPVTASVITGDDAVDLPIQIRQDALGSGARQIYMDWEQWRHVCQLVDSNAPARKPALICGAMDEGGGPCVILHSVDHMSHVSAGGVGWANSDYVPPF